MWVAGKGLAIWALLAVAAAPDPAVAADGQPSGVAGEATAQPSTVRQRVGSQRQGTQRAAPVRQAGGISCVPYARMATGMAVTGNGWQWWDNAAGLYSRGRRPEAGSVLAFQSSGGMSRGHVAVVNRVVGARHVMIEHANWAGPGIRRGTVMRDVSVVDVSEDNDWTAVRVQVGHDAGTFGRQYPTYGFIYNRPDPDTAFAGLAARRSARFEQVAEHPVGAGPQGQAGSRTGGAGRGPHPGH